MKIYRGVRLTNEEKQDTDRVKIRSLFWKALLAEISAAEMENIFNHRSLPFSHLVRIHLDPIAIIHVMEKFLQNEIDEWFVKEWALFILMMDCYVSPNYEYYISDTCSDINGEIADKYECVWYVVQQLSAPEIDGKLTPDKAREHIQFLQDFMEKTP
jgi:hypothetical protein